MTGSAAARVARCLTPSMAASATSAAEQPDGADGVVVGGDDVVEQVRVDVGVTGADDRDLELARLGHRDVLAVRVDDEQRAGQALHLRMPPSVRWSRVISSVSCEASFLVSRSKSPFCLACLELVEQAEALADGHEVGEHAAQPALVDVGHLGARRLFGDRLLRLLLGADEQDRVALGDGVA